MERRNFFKTVGLSLIAANSIFNSKLEASENFNGNGKQIIEFFCSGGADFRYLFAPVEDSEYKSLYLSKQRDIIDISEYEKITVKDKEILIRKDANELKNNLLNNDIAVISNVWFSPNRDHNYSVKKTLLGKNEKVTPFNETDSSWLGKIAGYTNKNIIQNSNYFSYACNIRKEDFPNSEIISAIDTRPFGIRHNNNYIDKALQRFYINSSNQQDLPNHFISQERKLIKFSKKVNDFLSTTSPVKMNTDSGYLNKSVQSLFDSIDSRNIFNSSNYYLTYGSFDFHNDFYSLNNKFINIFGDKQALSTMISELKKRNLWDNTVIIINSEFGRQIKQNGRKGKDHGHGNLLFLAGGAVNGGLYGDFFPKSEIPKWKSNVGHDIEGLTNGLSIYAQVSDYISDGLGDLIFPSRYDMVVEEEYEIFSN